MSGMGRYYLSRTFIAIVLGVVFGAASGRWWVGLLTGALTMAYFLWVPRSGRYVVDPQRGLTALQHDERTLAISSKAACNGFIAVVLSIGAISVYFGMTGADQVPTWLATQVVVVGFLVYLASDLWHRRM